MVHCAPRHDSFDSLVNSRGARRIVASHTAAANSNAAGIDLRPLLQVINNGAHRAIVVLAPTHLELGLALARAIESKGRQTALDAIVVDDNVILFGRIETTHENHARRRFDPMRHTKMTSETNP